ncbi:hypothetical protein like AT2G04420 [Hibiscus trionum]|uniref:RNase H type-1 domain-containing protein n=1 Tax=Hibiscus trionum TaxID=183268 RepID=A0A9W7I6B2_HIBTR|nr:hypothetical protein like AT2G04420 [Hibiscus trionum]
MPVRWSPPCSSTVKINVDACFFPNTKSAQVGVLIRDNEGFILGAKAAKLDHTSSSFAAEAEVVVYDIRLALDLGFRHVIIEGDSLLVMRKLQFGADDRSEVSALVWNALHLAKNLQIVTFSFVMRDENKAAHEMARVPLTSTSEIIWVEEAPATVEAIAAMDRRWTEPP